MTTVLVTGAAGNLGRHLVRRLVAAGHPVRAISRRPQAAEPGVEWIQADLTNGDGLAAALTNVDSVIHAASDSRRWRNDAIAARHLIDAARQAGEPHLVYISIVGIDRIKFGYYAAKLAVERLLAEYPRHTILRTTQFHDLVAAAVGVLAKSPIVPVPSRTAIQPVEVGEVAERLIDLALGVPLGRVPDLGGPQVRTAADLARTWLRMRGKHRILVPVRLPGQAGRALRAGHLTVPQHADGKRTFEEYLADADPNLLYPGR
jgi:uncharacterized protein YbjT (DUF2867 family)